MIKIKRSTELREHYKKMKFHGYPKTNSTTHGARTKGVPKPTPITPRQLWQNGEAVLAVAKKNCEDVLAVARRQQNLACDKSGWDSD